MIIKAVPISTRIVISYVIKWGILLWMWWKVNGNWDNNIIRVSEHSESHSRKSTSTQKKIQKSKTVRITVWDPSRKVTHVSKVIGGRKIIAEFTRLISSTRIGKPVLMMDVKVSKDKNSNGLIERTWSMLDETESETVLKDKESDG